MLCTAAAPACASTFDISPIRANLGAAHRTEALSIVNAQDSAVVVQVHIVAWAQKDGEEQYEDTHEVLVTPPVLQIGPNAQQIVRVALRREPDASVELAYRVFFEEVPQAAPPNFTGLRVALRLSIPIFVAPLQGEATAQLQWASHRLPDGRIELSATNRGARHMQVTDFAASAGLAAPLHAEPSKYILPGSRMSWTLAGQPDALPLGAIVIRGHSDQGDFSADAAPTEL